MIPPPIRGDDDDKLHERIEPVSWAHLGGPMRWYRFVDSEVQETSEHGVVARVETIGPIGEMVNHFSEHGRFPRQSYLKAGPKGVGKTALIRLMAVTHIAEGHEPVTYESGGREITMVSASTGKPFVADPITDKERNFEVVRREMRSNTEGDVSPQMVEAYNAGQLKKAQVDQIAGSVNVPLMMYGGRRVVIMNEIDQLGSRQTPSLKSKLDPGGGMPDGFLLLSDTNHISDVRSSMDSAGMDRFEVIQFQKWRQEALARYAQAYLQELGIKISEADFGGHETQAPEQAAASEIALRSGGSIRALISGMQSFVSQDSPVGQADIKSVYAEDSSASADGRSNALVRYRKNVLRGRTTAVNFASTCAKRSVDPTGFANRLSRYLMDEHSWLVGSDLAPALQNLFQIAQTPEGRPATDSRWAAMAGPLTRIAEVIGK